jgi:hypothetical protein
MALNVFDMRFIIGYNQFGGCICASYLGLVHLIQLVVVGFLCF